MIFSQSKNKAGAKEFVKFLMEEENLGLYVEGALGRWFPVTKAGQASPFWQDRASIARRSTPSSREAPRRSIS